MSFSVFLWGCLETPGDVYNFLYDGAVVQITTQNKTRREKYGSKPENQNQVKGL